jgi:hypothetical protein
MSGTLLARSSAVLDWYWRQGLQRVGEHDLSGAWLDQLYQLRDAAAAVESASAAAHPCLALWGPSQSGKSTLLSRYLDAPSQPDAVSALQWHKDAPVAFVGRPDKPDMPGCVHLNPYNQQRDASGCVTRFVLRREVADPLHPVELKLASEEQALHALAAGYLMECDTRTPEGRDLFLDPAAIDAKISELKGRLPGRLQTTRPVRERLHTVLNVLDDLIAADWARYLNLKPDWHALRPRLASDPLLRADSGALIEFAAWLFWGSQPALTSLWQNLLAQRSRVLSQAGGRSIFCSFQVARLFLDIDAYRKLQQEGPSGGLATQIRSIGFETGEPADVLRLGQGLRNPAFGTAEEFGLYQGLVWEMTLPVNAALLPADSPAARLLGAADLLDFPGVALTYPGGERKRPADISPVQLLTEVLKRGKTASIVVTRSRQLGIDGFSILNRIQAPPAQPTQLLTGIQAWVRALGQPWPPPPGVLPINLVLTFAARLVNSVTDSLQLQRPSADFSPVFEFLNKLGDLANPQWVQFFTTTYPRFDEGCIRGSPQEIEQATRLISESDDFRRHFGSCLDSLRAMIAGGEAGKDGGNDFLLNALALQAGQSRLPALLAQRARELQRHFAALLEEALPPAAAGEARRGLEIDAWAQAIETAIDRQRQEHPEADAAVQISRRLRQLLDIEPELLEPIPLAAQNPDWRGYIESQLSRWRELAKGRDGDWADLGLKDAASASRHLGYLAEQALLRGNLHRWLRDNLGDLNNHLDAAHARRFLAVRLAEMICFGVDGRPPHRDFSAETSAPARRAPSHPSEAHPPTPDAIQPRLRSYADREQQDPEARDDRQSPHYLGFLKPFLHHLTQVKASPATARKPQPGDGELAQLAATVSSEP